MFIDKAELNLGFETAFHDLGPLAEPALRQSHLLWSGKFSIFLARPIAGVNLVITVVLLMLPLYPMIKRRVVGRFPGKLRSAVVNV